MKKYILILASIILFSCSNDQIGNVSMIDTLTMRNQELEGYILKANFIKDSLSRMQQVLRDSLSDEKQKSKSLSDALKFKEKPDTVFVFNPLNSIVFHFKGSNLFHFKHSTLFHFKDSILFHFKDSILFHFKDSILFHFKDSTIYYLTGLNIKNIDSLLSWGTVDSFRSILERCSNKKRKAAWGKQ